ncbi:hypothetical protein PG988_002073 [Apiospora saccharicola]
MTVRRWQRLQESKLYKLLFRVPFKAPKGEGGDAKETHETTTRSNVLSAMLGASESTRYSHAKIDPSNEESNDASVLTDRSLPQRPRDLLIDQSVTVKAHHGKEHRLQPVLLDSGTYWSFLSRSKAKEMDVEVMPTLQKLYTLEGSFEATAFAILTLCLPEIGSGWVQIVALVHTLKAPFDLVIGRKDMHRHQLLEKSLDRQRSLGRLDGLEPAWARRTGFVGVTMGHRTKEQKSRDKKDQEENKDLANELQKDRKKGSSSASGSSTQGSTTFDRGSRTTSTTAPSTTSKYSKHS